jgi:hypothetical protein
MNDVVWGACTDPEYSVIDGTIVHITEKAILIEVKESEDKFREIWIPKSVIHGGDVFTENDIGDDFEFEIQTWFGERENLL